MRSRDMLIFFLVVFIIYFSANSYIFIKGYRALSGHTSMVLYSTIFILLASTFIAGKVLERNASSVIADILNVVGGFWLAFMLYSFILLLLTDILFASGRIAGLITAENSGSFRQVAFISTLIISSLIILTGFINSVNPVVKHYRIGTNYPESGISPMRIVAVSDIHLGSVVRKRSLRILSGMIRDENPDVIFFLGDLVDGEINPVLRDDLLASFSLPDNAEVYAITGNHEFIGDFGKTAPYIREKGFRLLLDEVVELKNGVQVIGRVDRDSFRFTGKKRMELDELLTHTDPSRPVIILDHQPPGLNARGQADFDLMLSGHTHNGQMWPFSYIVKSLYHPSYGHSVDGRRNYIVSSGFGTWGPRVRIGSRSEIMVIDLEFEGSNK